MDQNAEQRPAAEPRSDAFDDNLPTAQELLDRVNAIDLTQLDVELVASDLLGPWKWARVLAMPIGALLLFLLTWLGSYFTHVLISFTASAILVLLIGKWLDRYERSLKLQARKVVEGRIAEIEGTDGLLLYFQDFLPKRYKPLIKALQKGHYYYIPQYIEAVELLRKQLDPVKFQTWWLIKRDSLKTLGKPLRYYTSRAERLKLLSDEDLQTLLEQAKEHDILNLLLLTHDEALARRVLNLLSVMIANQVKNELYAVQKLDDEAAKLSVERILELGKKLARKGQLSVEPDFFA